MSKGYNDKEIKVIGKQMMFHPDEVILFHENGGRCEHTFV